MLLYQRKAIYRAVCFILWIACSGCGSSKPSYPEPTIYPGSIIIEPWEKTDPHVRVTAFLTPDTPEQVLTYYRRTLVATGWEISREEAAALGARYLNGSDHPAFGLWIETSMAENNRIKVRLTQTMSGNFGWDVP